MQGEALLKIGGILEKLSNDITILKNNSIGISGSSNPSSNSIQPKQSKPRSRSNSSTSNKKMTRPILRSTSQKRRIANKSTKRMSLKKKQVKRQSKPKSSTKKNKRR